MTEQNFKLMTEGFEKNWEAVTKPIKFSLMTKNIKKLKYFLQNLSTLIKKNRKSYKRVKFFTKRKRLGNLQN